MPAISDVREREGKGGEMRGERREEQESERAANCVNKRRVFYPIFSDNLTCCYTAVGGLIHSSAGLAVSEQ